MSTWKRIKRSELYRQVWEQPMTQLARTYGISDVGLAKVCRKHDIPRPPRGYWAQKVHGKAPAKSPLPEQADDVDIELRDPETIARPSSAFVAAASEKVAEEASVDMKIEVAPTLHGSHPLVRQAHEELQNAKVGSNGLINYTSGFTLFVYTSKNSLRRALLIMDALLKALEQRGYPVTKGPEVCIDGVKLRFSVSEQMDPKKEPVDDVDLDGAYQFHHSRFREIKVPSGRLMLTIENGDLGYGEFARRRWGDTEKAKIEERLNKFVGGLIQMAAKVKAWEEKRAQQEIARREAEKRAQEQARILEQQQAQYKQEKARVTALLKDAENWGKSQRLRDYVEAVRKSRGKGKDAAAGQGIEAWIVWALAQADRLDPLTPSPPSILDHPELEQKEPERSQFRW